MFSKPFKIYVRTINTFSITISCCFKFYFFKQFDFDDLSISESKQSDTLISITPNPRFLRQYDLNVAFVVGMAITCLPIVARDF